MFISNILLFQIIKTILKPEICTQPILQTGIKDNIKSLNKISIIPNRKTWIEFIIDFKDNNILLDYYLSISSTDNKFLSLVSYDYIFLNGVITFTNKVIDTNFSFIHQKNYYVFQEKSNKNKQVVSMFSFIEFFDFSFYNYIYKKENKAWKFIILLNNKNNEIIELQTFVFRLIINDGKIELEIFDDGLFNNNTTPPQNKSILINMLS